MFNKENRVGVYGIITFLSLFPIILLTTINIKYYEYYDIDTYLLVWSNLAILPSCMWCLYQSYIHKYSLYLEFLTGYCLLFASSLYHLCDSSQLTCNNYETYLQYFDFILSYHMISVLIIYLAQLIWYCKIFAHSVMLTCTSLYIIYGDIHNVLANLGIVSISFCFVLIRVLERVYNNKINEYLNKYDIYDIPPLIILITVACIGKFYLENEYQYYIFHSITWHLPIMLSTYFGFELFHKNCYCLFYNRCNELSVSNDKNTPLIMS